jgi:hypothetical protein
MDYLAGFGSTTLALPNIVLSAHLVASQDYCLGFAAARKLLMSGLGGRGNPIFSESP